MENNKNQNNKKWIPYFLREDSIYIFAVKIWLTMQLLMQVIEML